MSLQDWLNNKWLRLHQTSPEEIGNLMGIVERDIKDACRIKRNKVEYDYSGGVTHTEADELTKFVIELKHDVIKWLKGNYPDLIK